MKKWVGAGLVVTAGLLVCSPGVAYASTNPSLTITINIQLLPSCDAASAGSAGSAACNAVLHADAKWKGESSPESEAGYHPADLQSAYGLTTASAAKGTGQTVAIVDAYDDPTAASDLATYRAQFGLSACTTANGCFKKVNQAGKTTYPAANAGWDEEISLDLDMVSAICPNCHILLVEANSASMANLGAAEDEAVALGATEVSNSYGGSDAADSQYGSYFDHPGVAITASAGDSGYGVEYPASSDYVTAVGGTTLTKSTSTTRGWTETAWSDTGSGCSTKNARPQWQAVISTDCTDRAVADVAADADPNTGVAVYDSVSYEGYSGWLEFGGTSVASPIIASVYALAGNAKSVVEASYPYSHSSGLYDITSGSNGSCSTTQARLCTAGAGWDGPTGLGTPDGTSSF
jgi:subtilase family serine protease